MSDIKLEHGVWVVVADGEKALFLRNQGDNEYPTLEVVREVKDDNPPTREQGTDRPGRHSDGAGNPHNSGYEETDWHQLEKDRFASGIADKLYKLAHRNAFEKLILVAPASVLGEMRKLMHKEVSDKITAEVAKTLTNHPIHEIEKLLKAA